MTSDPSVADIRDLFVHRDDVFAAQQESGAYYPMRDPLTDDDIAEHLAGLASYGVYVIKPVENTVKYLCFDLDTHDEEAKEHLAHCVEELVGGHEPFECLLMEWSGNKGIHVWLFFDQPIAAEKVRRWVSADFLPAWEEKAKEHGWPLEVFPKQDDVPEGGFGNLVKLPFGRHAVTGNFSQVVPRTGWANSVQEVVPLPSGLVPDREAVVGPSRDATRNRNRPQSASGRSGPTTPFPCVDHILRDGVGQGYRDRAMFHLALYFYGHGVDEDLAFEMCIRANEEFDPPLSEREVEDKVSSAYRGRYVSARCGTDWLAEICPGPCQTGWSVRRAEGGSLRRAQEGDVVEVEVVRRQAEEGRVRVTVSHPDADNTPTFICGRGGGT